MISKLHVLSQADFDIWLKQKVQERYRPIDAADAMDPAFEELADYDGAVLYGKYCAACHMKDGRGGGPYEARNLTSLEGWQRGTKLTDVFWTITRGLDGTQMRAFAHLPVRERFAIMHHVGTFAEGDQRPAVDQADLAALKKECPETDPSQAQQAVELEPQVPMDEAMKKVVDDARR